MFFLLCLTICCVEKQGEKNALSGKSQENAPANITIIGPAEGIDYCNSIAETDKKNKCIIDLVGSAGNSSLCRYVSGYEEGYHCTSVAARTKSMRSRSDCDGLLNRYYYERCLSEIAVVNKNASICILSDGESDDPRVEMPCINKVAQALNDSSICNMLKQEENRRSCTEYFTMK